MAVSYNKLWKLMIDKGLNKTKLRTKQEFHLMLWQKSEKTSQFK